MSLSKKVNQRVWEKTEGRCWYCGNGLVRVTLDNVNRVPSNQWFTADHILPRNRGGGHAIDNLLPCCHHCNITKHDLTLEEYRIYLSYKQNNIPRFSDEQLVYLQSLGITLPELELVVFWAEEQGL